MPKIIEQIKKHKNTKYFNDDDKVKRNSKVPMITKLKLNEILQDHLGI